MIWLHSNEAVQQLSENVLLYDLAQIRGTDAVLSRIPQHMSGVYAWYRRFQVEELAKDDPEVFTQFILNELSKDHSAPRETRLPPAHKITLQAETSFPKAILLKELASDSAFRQLLFVLLNNSLIFQQPLYIGKASDLNSRIRSHLQPGSILRERLTYAFAAINAGNDKIKVAKAVEDRIFSLLCLWYFGSRKVEIDATNGIPMLSKRRLLHFFSTETSTAMWPKCKSAYDALYKGFDTNAFYGKDHDKLSKSKKEDLVRDRFSTVFVMGLPEIYNQSRKGQSSPDEEEES